MRLEELDWLPLSRRDEGAFASFSEDVEMQSRVLWVCCGLLLLPRREQRLVPATEENKTLKTLKISQF